MTVFTIVHELKIQTFAGLAQYSGDPKTEWHLNAHPTKESLLRAITNLPYKGGNTMTGDVTAFCPVLTIVTGVSRAEKSNPHYS